MSDPKTIPKECEEAMCHFAVDFNGKSIDALRAAIRRALDEQIEACAKVVNEEAAKVAKQAEACGDYRKGPRLDGQAEGLEHAAEMILKLKGGGA